MPEPRVSRQVAPEDTRRRALGLLESGQLAAALPLFEELLTAMPEHYETVLDTAALRAAAGDVGSGQRLLTQYFQRHSLGPYTGSGAPERPLVLVLRGFNQTRAVLGPDDDGRWSSRLRGGHFSTQFLLDPDRLAQRRFTIAGDGPLDPGALPPHDLLLNTMSDPDIEGPALGALARYLEAHPGTPVINRPEQVWHTARDRNWERLRGFDRQIVFPRTLRLKLRGAPAADVAKGLAEAGFEMPYILRAAGTQSGRSTARIDSYADLERYAAAGLTGTFFAIAYHEALWQGAYFRKLRLFQIDGAYYPVVCHLDRVWNVHGGNRKHVMRGDEALIAEEKRFLSDWRAYVGRANADALDRVAAATGLEFFGIDFTVDGDGRVLIYELNASMRHSFDHAHNFPYKMPYDLATSAAFEAMIRRRLPAPLH